MKTVTEKRMNILSRQEETTVFVEINGEKNYWGKATNPFEAIAMVTEANKWIEENKGDK